MEIFAERLKELRIERGLSQSELARRTGLSRIAINHWEHCNRLPMATAIIILAKFFGVSADYLLGLED